MMKTSEFLQEMRGHLAKGWGQGQHFTPSGPCIMGSCYITLRDKRLDFSKYSPALAEVRRQIAVNYPEGEWIWNGDGVIPSFNDAPDRTQDEVLAVMDKAILACRERGE